MKSNEKIIIENTIDYIKNFFRNDCTGHDYFHIIRVYKLAREIAILENADIFIVSLAALLHDVDDSKVTIKGNNNALNYLKSQNIDSDTIDKVMYIIENQSFRESINNNSELKLFEAKIVQDADRLDSMGAIGICRSFTYGGHKNRKVYDPDKKPIVYETKEQYVNNDSTTINHFYEKLLKLKDLMNTETAKKIAAHRHEYMLNYLEEFYDEWNGRK